MDICFRCTLLFVSYLVFIEHTIRFVCLTFSPLINPRITIQDRQIKFLQNKRETYNTQRSDANRTRSPTLSREIEPGLLTTRPQRPDYFLYILTVFVSVFIRSALPYYTRCNNFLFKEKKCIFFSQNPLI